MENGIYNMLIITLHQIRVAIHLRSLKDGMNQQIDILIFLVFLKKDVVAVKPINCLASLPMTQFRVFGVGYNEAI